MLMIDIGSGKGGASQGMIARGWKVITVDINPAFNPTICADIRNWHYAGPRPDLAWWSPPCDDFAREFMPWSKTGKTPDVSLMLAGYRVIQEMNPRYWVIENVKGSLKYFIPILGNPQYVCNPYYLWGYFPDISNVRINSNKEHLSSTRAAERAIIPYRLSSALAEAIEMQHSIFTEEIL